MKNFLVYCYLFYFIKFIIYGRFTSSIITTNLHRLTENILKKRLNNPLKQRTIK